MADLHDEIAHIETTPPPTVSKDWEVQFAKIVKGRKQSKYHRNYIATHVVEDFIRKTLATQRKEIASAVTEVLVGFDVENRSASELHKEVSEAIQAIERLG